MTATRGDLDGIVVVDGSTSLAGAYCAKLLADAGATVTLVEPPEGAPLRRWAHGHEPPAGEDGALFRFLRHGQRSVTSGDGARTAALVAGADVVITSGPGPLGAAEALAAADPGLIVVSITPYGLTGPFADRPATEFTIQADSGALGVRGTADRPPIQMGGRLTEWVTGAYAAAAVLATRRRQVADGDGDLLDVAVCDVANISGGLFADLMFSLLGRPPIDPTLPARSVELPSIEPTLDGWVGFNTNTRVQFEGFCLMIGRPDLMTDEWAGLQHRVANAEQWNAWVREWTTQRTTAEIVDLAVELRVPVAPVCDGASVLDLDMVQARGIMVDDPTGSFRMPRRPFLVDGEAPPPPRPAPALGAHDGEPAPQHAPRPAPSGRDALPLAGLKVVDLTAWWAGPTASHIFSTLGAEVVHVEAVQRMDGVRLTGGMLFGREGWWECATFFLQANANKDDVTLDLGNPVGRDLVLRMIEQADLVIENYTPRVLEQFDLAWDVVHAVNPRAVMVRMPAFGLTGPWRDRPGFAQTMEQVTGMAWMTGHADDQPRIPRGPCDPNGGVHAAIGALVGLAQRDRTGIGCLVEAAMVEAAMNIAAEPVIEWTAYGNGIARDGNRSPYAAPQNLYATDTPEAWLAVSCETDDQWRALTDVLGRSDLAADAALATLAGRRADHDRLDEIVGAWAAEQAVDGAVDTLLAAGVPAARVRDPRTASMHPQMVARGYFEMVEHPVAGTHPVQGLPWRSRGVERWIRRPAPTLGQHNHEVLGARLGLTPDEIATLEADGLIGTRPLGL